MSKNKCLPALTDAELETAHGGNFWWALGGYLGGKAIDWAAPKVGRAIQDSHRSRGSSRPTYQRSQIDPRPTPASSSHRVNRPRH